MKAVVSKLDLVTLIGKIQSVIASKPAIPILVNVLIEAVDDQLIISATDLLVSIRCFIEAKVIEEGAIALPARRFFQLVREITSPQIKISAASAEMAEITTGSSVFKINGMNRSEFPPFPDLSGALRVQLPNATLKSMLSKTVFSAAKEDSRYMLNGVRVRIGGQTATFIGTDGKRLAKAITQVNVEPSVQGAYVLPLKAVDEMIKMLDESEQEATLLLANDKISLESGNLILVSKLLAGQYPDVERVIPAKLLYQFAVHREELMALLRQISLFTSETSSSVRFSFETGQLHLAAMSSDIGEGRVSMPVDFSGSKLDIAFNPYFFLDILRHSTEETVLFGLNDAHNPGLITDASGALFVIMPMRLTDAPALAKVEESAVSTYS